MARRDAGLAPHWSRTDAAKAQEPCHAEVRRGVRTQANISGQCIAIDALYFAVYETLAAALHPYGATCIWTPRGRGKPEHSDAGIFDGSQLEPAEVAELRRCCDRFDRRPAPVIVLLDFPRAEHFSTLRDAGAFTILGKPYSIAALAAELARILSPDAADACLFASPRSENASESCRVT
jgi:hypothetical protein